MPQVVDLCDTLQFRLRANERDLHDILSRSTDRLGRLSLVREPIASAREGWGGEGQGVKGGEGTEWHVIPPKEASAASRLPPGPTTAADGSWPVQSFGPKGSWGGVRARPVPRRGREGCRRRGWDSRWWFSGVSSIFLLSRWRA